MLKPYEFPSKKKKILIKVERADLVTKLEIAKMIDQIDKKLLTGVVIPNTHPSDKLSRIQTLDKTFEISSFDGEDPKVGAIKIVANCKAP